MKKFLINKVYIVMILSLASIIATSKQDTKKENVETCYFTVWTREAIENDIRSLVGETCWDKSCLEKNVAIYKKAYEECKNIHPELLEYFTYILKDFLNNNLEEPDNGMHNAFLNCVRYKFETYFLSVVKDIQ